MKEIKASDLNVGDIVYNQISLHHGFSYIGSYYRKEVIERITPKRTKIITDHGEYKQYHAFYEYSDEIEEINKITISRRKICNFSYNIRSLIEKEKAYAKLDVEKVIKVSELMEEANKLLEGDEQKCN